MYPTKEQIINPKLKFKKETIAAVLSWKKEIWKKVPKMEALTILIQTLANLYDKPVSVSRTDNKSCYYNIATQTIYINDSLSIISALHEFAHHLFGSSELKACRWSVQLFQLTFPKAFERLVWQGHMLKKQ